MAHFSTFRFSLYNQALQTQHSIAKQLKANGTLGDCIDAITLP